MKVLLILIFFLFSVFANAKKSEKDIIIKNEPKMGIEKSIIGNAGIILNGGLSTSKSIIKNKADKKVSIKMLKGSIVSSKIGKKSQVINSNLGMSIRGEKINIANTTIKNKANDKSFNEISKNKKLSSKKIQINSSLIKKKKKPNPYNYIVIKNSKTKVNDVSIKNKYMLKNLKIKNNALSNKIKSEKQKIKGSAITKSTRIGKNKIMIKEANINKPKIGGPTIANNKNKVESIVVKSKNSIVIVEKSDLNIKSGPNIKGTSLGTNNVTVKNTTGRIILNEEKNDSNDVNLSQKNKLKNSEVSNKDVLGVGGGSMNNNKNSVSNIVLKNSN